jgi:peptidyl-prolyl cis-trans isomerase A (cyclophilin A)
VRFVTSKGTFDVRVHRAWAPQGADRMYDLVQERFYDGVRFFRVIGGFMAQFGAHGDPAVAARWSSRTIPDDPVTKSNTRGMLTFAKTTAPNSRTTQLFINFGDNSRLDASGFAPIGRVLGNGMTVVDALYSGYGEAAPSGSGPEQGRIAAEGNAYLRREFPLLDSVATARVVEEWKRP